MEDSPTFAEQRDRDLKTAEQPKSTDRWLVLAGICASGSEYDVAGTIDNVEYVIEAPTMYVVLEKLDAELLRVEKEAGTGTKLRLMSVNARLLPQPL